MKRTALDIELRSVPEDSTRLSTLLGEFLDGLPVPQRAKHDVMISCDEVFSNIYMHVYKRVPGGSIKFNCKVACGCITVTFIHQGESIPGEQEPSLPEDKSSEGGYGLFIIHKLMDEVRTSRTESGIIITLKKRYIERGGQ